jgi:Proteasome subunit
LILQRTHLTGLIQVLVLFLVFAPTALGTTIVVIRTPQEVVIAADSFGTIQGDGLSPSTESVCKIYQVNRELFFAVSGLVRDPQSGFSIPKVVGSAAAEGGSVSDILARTESAVIAAVLRELPEVKKRDPAGYEKLIKAKGAVTVMLAGIEKGVPLATSFSLGLERPADGPVETSITRGRRLGGS